MKMLRTILCVMHMLFFLKVIVETMSDQNVLSNLYTRTSVNTSSANANKVNIIGGFKARAGQFPYMVAIGYTEFFRIKNEFICGGSIIGVKSVLTAAHCFYQTFTRKAYLVLAGTLALNLKAPHQLLDVENIITHPKFKDIHSGFDIAVVITTDNFRFNEFVDIIQLGSSTIKENEACVVSGWGSITADGSTFSNTLNALVMHVRNYSVCSEYYSSHIQRFNIICAGGEDLNKDTCIGDSGGPLVCGGKQYGVLSFGSEECGMGEPMYFCDATVFNGWVLEVLYLKNEKPVHYSTMVLELITSLLALLLSS